MHRSPPEQSNSYAASSLPVFSLLISAALWGGSWYPFRLLEDQGIAGLWGVVLSQLIAALICLIYWGRRLLTLRWISPVWVIGLLGGLCNASYVMGAIAGDVMRVTLLLYLSPLWTLFLSRWLLHEPLSPIEMAVVMLSLAGGGWMLLPLDANAASLGEGDVWGIVAGMALAAYSVLVRRHLELPIVHKTFAVMLGTSVVAIAIMALGSYGPMPELTGSSEAIIIAVAVVLVINSALQQYGLERLNPVRASLLMMSELIFAILFAWWWADEVPGSRELIGGMFIILAAALGPIVAGKRKVNRPRFNCPND